MVLNATFEWILGFECNSEWIEGFECDLNEWWSTPYPFKQTESCLWPFDSSLTSNRHGPALSIHLTVICNNYSYYGDVAYLLHISLMAYENLLPIIGQVNSEWIVVFECVLNVWWNTPNPFEQTKSCLWPFDPLSTRSDSTHRKSGILVTVMWLMNWLHISLVAYENVLPIIGQVNEWMYYLIVIHLLAISWIS